MRAVEVGGEGWRMRPRDRRQVVENEAARLAARTGVLIKIVNDALRIIKKF